MHFNRREFLRKSVYAALGGASVYSALGNLRLVQAAARQSAYAFNDYKALVCVYLGGGNDSFNTVVPYDATNYATYAGSRHDLALTQASIQANALTALPASGGLPGGPPSDGGSYGLHPALGNMTATTFGGIPGNAGLRALFNSGKAAIVANVGTLLYPVTQTQFQAGSQPTPPQLYSHDDQTTQWQTSRPDDANSTGWGGRIADLLYAGNANQSLPMSFSLAGQNIFQRGTVVNQYAVDAWGAATAAALCGQPDQACFGVAEMDYLGNGPGSWIMDTANNTLADNAAAYNALIAPGTQANALERAYASAHGRAISNYTAMNSALSNVTLNTKFPDSDLGNQLAAIALLLKVRGPLGMNRQVFFVSTGGYDTHGDQLTSQNDNLLDLGQSLNAFYNATVELGIDSGVTAFTASEFGRSLAVNVDGTDHGWGGHHFVVGGAVRGQRFYGAMPSLLAGTDADPNLNPDDTGYGQIIPTLAVDQYAATLAAWFGVSGSDLGTIFPNLGRFSASNLRFLG